MNTLARFRYMIGCLLCVAIISLQFGTGNTATLILAQNDLPQTDIIRVDLEDEMTVSVAWSPDGNTLAIGTADGSVWLFSDDTLREITIADGLISALAWSPDSQLLAFAALGEFPDGEVIVWDTLNEAVVTIFEEALTITLDWHSQDNIIAIVQGRLVQLADVISGELQTFRTPERIEGGFTHFIVRACWLGNSNRLAFFSNGGGGFIDTDTAEISLSDFLYVEDFNSGDCSPDGNWVVTQYGWVINTNSLLRLPRYEDIRSGRLTVRWNPAHNIIATRTANNITIWDAFTRETYAILETSYIEIPQRIFGHSISWHPDGELLAEATNDDFVSIWQIESD